MGLIGGVAVIEKQGRVLLIRQSRKKPLGGQWRHPGGKFEEGEDPLEGLKREIMEETGLIIEVMGKEPLFVAESDYDSGRFGFFRARVVGGELSIESSEIEQAGWFTPKEIMGLNLMAATMTFYQNVRSVVHREEKG